MENILRSIQDGKIRGAEVSLVVSDNSQAYALKRAEKYNAECVVVDRKRFDSKESFEAEIKRHLERKKIDYILLAGFMRILSSSFVKTYQRRIINIHPALLPNFPGAHAIKDAWEAKAKTTGVTVHFVDKGVDTGPIILQREVPIEANDTLESLERKVHEVEYKIYPEAINLVLEGKAKPKKQGTKKS
ncbi:MAG: phosphoribosylglycinamide formyltransferase [Candidatus Omnitrophica bacterium]|nr:phosphoribosylglycinamide formyltransferase [Candidatus Omnitrophota bacterium]